MCMPHRFGSAVGGNVLSGRGGAPLPAADLPGDRAASAENCPAARRSPAGCCLAANSGRRRHNANPPPGCRPLPRTHRPANSPLPAAIPSPAVAWCWRPAGSATTDARAGRRPDPRRRLRQAVVDATGRHRLPRWVTTPRQGVVDPPTPCPYPGSTGPPAGAPGSGCLILRRKPLLLLLLRSLIIRCAAGFMRA